MAQSKQFRALEREVERLRSNFLPAVFDPLGSYPHASKVQAGTRAFIVLAHAEIESYFEGRAKEIARASEDLWKTRARASQPFNFILATHGRELAVHSAFVAGNDEAPTRYDKCVAAAFQSYYKAIKDNHGIKEPNFLSLFTPLGVLISRFNSTLLTNLEAFGSLRGDQAHHSAQAVITPLDPEIEFNRVQTLMVDLAGVDTWLTECKRSVR